MNRNPILHNPILEEVWRAKDEVAAEYDYDVRKLIRSISQAVKQPSRDDGASAAGRKKRTRKQPIRKQPARKE